MKTESAECFLALLQVAQRVIDRDDQVARFEASCADRIRYLLQRRKSVTNCRRRSWLLLASEQRGTHSYLLYAIFIVASPVCSPQVTNNYLR
jgi:hypothetical protein